ncbi:hypothetical protein F5Y09DRAFT_322626 [Xylaria sp. FL1042]|nr:hypothetical protein F5Y09DRAFT_322626 [Xylaria sp. FL1042]
MTVVLFSFTRNISGLFVVQRRMVSGLMSWVLWLLDCISTVPFLNALHICLFYICTDWQSLLIDCFCQALLSSLYDNSKNSTPKNS